MTTTEAELQDRLIRVETAMTREGCTGRQVQRVINALVYGEPDGPEATYTTGEGRILRLQRALAQARAHEHALDRLQSELRSAGEAYAYCSALAVRDAAMDLVAQLRDDLGDKDPDLIVGEVVHGFDDEPERYEAAVRGLRANLHAMIDADMPQQSHLKTAITSMADHYADAVERPSPLLEMIRNRPDLRPSGNGHCYEASWGWVHSRPSCRCPR